MNYFFITRSEGAIPPADFIQRLKSQWPMATITPISNLASSHALEFGVPMEHSRVDGSLNREGCSIVFIGDLRDCADFALWCRTLFSQEEPATFCDESMSGSLELDGSTTRSDIFQAFSYQPPRE
jgi:hypothetical protein